MKKQGTDFHRVDHDFIIWQNKSALRVIPESIHMSPVEFFQFQVTGRNSTVKPGQESDQAIFWKLERKINHTIASTQLPFSQLFSSFPPEYLRSAHRSNENPYWKDHNLGF